MTLKTIEQKARYMDGETFFASYSQSAEYMRLPLATRREIMAGKYGLTWAQYSAIPAADRLNMNLGQAGHTYTAGVGEGVDAAQADARFASIRGFVSGLKFGSTSLILIALVAAAAVFWFRAPLSIGWKQLKKGYA